MTTFLDLSVRQGNSLVIDNARIDVPPPPPPGGEPSRGLSRPTAAARQRYSNQFGNPGTSA